MQNIIDAIQFMKENSSLVIANPNGWGVASLVSTSGKGLNKKSCTHILMGMRLFLFQLEPASAGEMEKGDLRGLYIPITGGFFVWNHMWSNDLHMLLPTNYSNIYIIKNEFHWSNWKSWLLWWLNVKYAIPLIRIIVWIKKIRKIELGPIYERG